MSFLLLFYISCSAVETADVYNIGTEQPRPIELLLPHPAVDGCRVYNSQSLGLSLPSNRHLIK